MVKIVKENVIELYEAEKELDRVYSREGETSTAEEKDAALKRVFLADVNLSDDDGEEVKRKGCFARELARVCVKADISVSRFLKCLEVCGVEVTEE